MRNRPIAIHTRDDLIDFVKTRVTRRSISRALSHSVEVLGGFQHIPPKGLPGWCLFAESPITGQRYKLGVTVEPGGEHRVWNLDKFDIPWPEWIGGHKAYDNNPLVQGDQPDLYKELKHAASSPEEESNEDEVVAGT